jgi:hypothetical protein
MIGYWLAIAAALVVPAASQAPVTVPLEPKVPESVRQTSQYGFISPWELTVLGSRTDGAGVSWPEFRSKAPLYGYIPRHGLPKRSGDKEPVHLAAALDQSGEHGDRYDILYVDLDNNREFMDDERLIGHPDGDVMEFGIAKVGVEGFAHPLYFDLFTNPWPRAGNHLDFVLCCRRVDYLEADVPLGTDRVPLRFYDTWLSGAYGDDPPDLLSIAGGKGHAISPVISYKGKCYSLSLAADATAVTVGPYEGAIGDLRIDVRTASGKEPNVDGSFEPGGGVSIPVSPKPGELTATPAGDGWLTLFLTIPENQSTSWWTSIRSLRTTVHEGKTTTVAVGAPLVAVLTIEGDPAPGADIRLAVTVGGRAGESYGGFMCKTSLKPEAVVRDVSGREVAHFAVEQRGTVWKIPDTAQEGDRYAFDVTLDTGPFGGKLTAQKTIVTGPTSSPP